MQPGEGRTTVSNQSSASQCVTHSSHRPAGMRGEGTWVPAFSEGVSSPRMDIVLNWPSRGHLWVQVAPVSLCLLSSHPCHVHKVPKFHSVCPSCVRVQALVLEYTSLDAFLWMFAKEMSYLPRHPHAVTDGPGWLPRTRVSEPERCCITHTEMGGACYRAASLGWELASPKSPGLETQRGSDAAAGV